METIIIPGVEETLEFLQAKADEGHVFYGSAVGDLAQIDPHIPTMNEHDRKTDELLSEGPYSLWTAEPEHAIFRGVYVEPFQQPRRDPNYVLGTLGVGIGWKDLTAADREFRGFVYEGTDHLQQLVAERAESGKLSAVYFAPKDTIGAEWREGMHDWVVRGKIVVPAGSVAVSGAHFTPPVLPYRGYNRPQ